MHPKATADWVDEEGTYPLSDDSFSQVVLGAYKLATMIKVSEELLSDSIFDIEGYVSEQFGKRIGDKEEDAFLNGNGVSKPIGILNATGGAEIGVTTAGASSITGDELIDLVYSLRAPYRKGAVFVLNDTTVKLLRKLKDGDGPVPLASGHYGKCAGHDSRTSHRDERVHAGRWRGE